MIRVIKGVDSSGKAAAQMLGNFRCLTWIALQVEGAGAIRFGSDKNEIEQVQLGGARGGFTIDQTLKIWGGWWKGQLWVIANQTQVGSPGIVLIYDFFLH